jgi:hypothetical protein
MDKVTSFLRRLARPVNGGCVSSKLNDVDDAYESVLTEDT